MAKADAKITHAAKATNESIAEILREIGEYLAMQEIPFKPRAYEKAALAIAESEIDVADEYAKGGIKALLEIPAVGASIAEKIEEFIKTGKVEYYEKLKKRTPVDLESLSRVEGLGPRSVKKLYQKLDVRNLEDLEAAAKAGKIAKLAGFGPRSQEKILKSIGFATSSSNQRFILGYMLPQIRKIQAHLEAVPGAQKVTVAGSARRKKDTIGDVDILAIAKDPVAMMKSFVVMPDVVNVIAHGETKSSVKLRSGVNVDLRVVPKASYGAALNYFTGSKDHNVALRRIAVAKKWKLNEYGLFSISGSEKKIGGETEEDLYKKFGMDYIEPELRENTGELEAAREHKLPKLIGYKDLEGDLQVQTSWTDGAETIEQMAEAALKQGLKYIVITDHTKRLAMAHGLDEKRITEQMKEIDKLNKKFSGKIRILKGSECDILKDGTLDLPDSILEKLDVVGVSVHSHFTLPRAEQTARVIRAISNPNADIFFHPTGRIINRREPIDIDVDEVIKVAKKTGTVMEVNSFPERSDLKDEYIRKCVDAGVKLSIDSDAHSSRHYAFLEFGIAQARRGWAERKDVINAWPVEKMLKCLKGAK
ncbi:MAG TPA: DNA polymerase/3'-5' exonuclease PolX [Candidatus Paceibacterota bacterium]|jgi:DNA polymerase (family 10)|nr:DNA polymerase/3'-5' exonuclease PolX [Candidatus Paceibacterota bacterium]